MAKKLSSCRLHMQASTTAPGLLRSPPFIIARSQWRESSCEKGQYHLYRHTRPHRDTHTTHTTHTRVKGEGDGVTDGPVDTEDFRIR